MMKSVELHDRSDDPFNHSGGRGRPQQQTDTAPAQCVSPLSFDSNRVFKNNGWGTEALYHSLLDSNL